MSLNEFVKALESTLLLLDRIRVVTDNTAYEVQQIIQSILPTIRNWEPSNSRQKLAQQIVVNKLENTPSQVIAYYANYDYYTRKHPNPQLLWTTIIGPAQSAINELLDAIQDNDRFA